MKIDLLFISPHLDDVVLSCSGLIINERLAGKKILVATIFSKGDDTAERKRDYEKRYLEDRAAMEFLGSEYKWLDFPDAPVRNRIYDSFIGRHLETVPSDFELVKEISARLVELWEETRPENIFFPLGVGSHIDHRLAFACASALPESARVIFYEDRPYVFLDWSLNFRFSEIGALVKNELPVDLVQSDRRECLHSFLRSFDRVHVFKNYPIRGSERFIAFRRMAKAFIHAQASDEIEFSPIMVLKTDRINQITHAASAYKSQFAGLFGSVEEFLEENRMYSSRLGSNIYAERYWGINSNSAGKGSLKGE